MFLEQMVLEGLFLVFSQRQLCVCVCVTLEREASSVDDGKPQSISQVPVKGFVFPFPKIRIE